ncbi:SigE family RNA polymerase sigma factor [Streptomyces sp. NPDC051987]|uniref:SigE family RNA polymerase sigma factor n=1 Tax=Streptomyces sp. NPDC051987 TaxID=3155808 RepID=UPI00341B6487
MRTATIPAAAPSLAWRRSMYKPVHPLFSGAVDLIRRAQYRLALRSTSSRKDGGRTLFKAVSLTTATAGDGHDFSALYQHRRLALVRLALLLVDDLPTAEDVVQDAFAALLRRHGSRLSDLDDPEAYIRTSVVNTARSVLRRRRTARAYIPEREHHAPPADKNVLPAETHQEVLNALQRLTRRQREVLVLRYWSDLTEAQIADTLNISRGTVKSTASRALDALGRHLEIPR